MQFDIEPSTLPQFRRYALFHATVVLKINVIISVCPLFSHLFFAALLWFSRRIVSCLMGCVYHLFKSASNVFCRSDEYRFVCVCVIPFECWCSSTVARSARWIRLCCILVLSHNRNHYSILGLYCIVNMRRSVLLFSENNTFSYCLPFISKINLLIWFCKRWLWFLFRSALSEKREKKKSIFNQCGEKVIIKSNEIQFHLSVSSSKADDGK